MYMYLPTFVGTCIYDTINAKGWLILLTKILSTLRVFWSVHLNTVSAIKNCCLSVSQAVMQLCSSAKLINSMPKFTHVCTCTCNYMYMYMIDPTHYTKDICTSLSTDAYAHTCIYMYTVLHHQKFPWYATKLSRFFFYSHFCLHVLHTYIVYRLPWPKFFVAHRIPAFLPMQ